MWFLASWKLLVSCRCRGLRVQTPWHLSHFVATELRDSSTFRLIRCSAFATSVMQACLARSNLTARQAFKRAHNLSGDTKGSRGFFHGPPATSSSLRRRSFRPSIDTTTSALSKSMGLPTASLQNQRVREFHPTSAMAYRAFIALGSNVGDRIRSIEGACAWMDSRPFIKVLRTSRLWETKPMYVLEQDKFVNAVCEVRPTSHQLCTCSRVNRLRPT